MHRVTEDLELVSGYKGFAGEAATLLRGANTLLSILLDIFEVSLTQADIVPVSLIMIGIHHPIVFLLVCFCKVKCSLV